jgi:hypothetical protein
MNHLGYLRTFNSIWGFLFLIVALGALVSGCFACSHGGRGMEAAQLAATAGGAFGAGVFSFILSMLHFSAGRKVAGGHGRGLQTILALVHILNFPLGTIYGGYALWVCWKNIDTKYMFS